MERPFLLGITGGSGSGKTHFLNKLLCSFPKDKICLISQDNYYKPKEHQPLDENGIQNFDLPDSIDFVQYAEDINALKRGSIVRRLEYTFNNPAAKPKELELKPAPIIVIEGIFVFYYAEIFNQLDLKVFIDAKEHIKIKRRILRDSSERGYDLHDVLYRYERHVVPSFEQHIEPFKYEADVIIPNNKSFEKGMELLVTYLNTKVLNKIS